MSLELKTIILSSIKIPKYVRELINEYSKITFQIFSKYINFSHESQSRSTSAPGHMKWSHHGVTCINVGRHLLKIAISINHNMTSVYSCQFSLQSVIVNLFCSTFKCIYWLSLENWCFEGSAHQDPFSHSFLIWLQIIFYGIWTYNSALRWQSQNKTIMVVSEKKYIIFLSYEILLL